MIDSDLNAHLRVAILDDVDLVRSRVKSFLEKDGYTVHCIGSARELLSALKEERSYDVFFLDDVLEEDISIGTFDELRSHDFPQAGFENGEILGTLGLTPEDTVSGLYLLPVVKAIQPTAHVLMLTAKAHELEHPRYVKYLSDWGCYQVIAKGRNDMDFTQHHTLFDLDNTLRQVLARIFKERLARQLNNRPMDLLQSYGRSLEIRDYLRELVKRFHANGKARAELLFYNPKQRKLEQIAEYNFKTTQDSMRIRDVPAGDTESWDGMGICAFAAAKAQSVLVPDVTTDPRYVAVTIEAAGETLSELAIRIADKDEVVGVLNLESSDRDAFNLQDQQDMEALAPLHALVLRNEIARQGEGWFSNSIKRLEGLAGERILAEFLKLVLERVDVRFGIALVPNPINSTLDPYGDERDTLRVVANRNCEDFASQLEVSDLGIIRRAYLSQEGEYYWTRGSGQDDLYKDIVDRGKHPDAEICSEFAWVLRSGGVPIAVLDVQSTRVAITERYRDYIKRLSSYVVSMMHFRTVQQDKERREALDVSAHTTLGHFHMAVDFLAERGDPAEILKHFREVGERLKADYKTIKELVNNEPSVVQPASVFQEFLAKSQVPGRVVGGDLVFKVHGAKTHVRRIFDNLITNTFKHVHGRARKCWGRFESEGDFGTIEYWDNGEAPKDLDDVRYSKRSGVQHIHTLCDHLKWEPEVTRNEETGGLMWRFRCPLVKPPAANDGMLWNA